MTTRTFSKLGVGLALALVTVACGGSTELTQSTPPRPETGGSAASSSPSGLLGTWQLVSLTEAGRATVSPREPERFTVEFAVDDRAYLRADCNRCNGGYTAKDENLAVGLMACTRAYCGSDSLDSRFVGLVAGATSWKASDGGLELRGEAGALMLRAVTPAR